MQFSQDIHCCCPLGHIERIAAEQASGVAASVKIVLWRSASENEQESMSACQSDAHALAVLATKWFQGNISAKGRVVVMIRQSDIRTALVSLAGSTEVFQPTLPERRLMQSRPLIQTATVGRPETFILCRLSGKVPAPRLGASQLPNHRTHRGGV